MKKILNSQNFVWGVSGGYIHRNVNIFTAIHQIKVYLFFEDSAAEIFVQQNVHNTTTKIMKTLFLRNDHTTF